jgi:hypothetical protein
MINYPMLKVECVGGPIDGIIEVHPMQNFEFMIDPSWPIGYYRGNHYDGKMYWINEKNPFAK